MSKVDSSIAARRQLLAQLPEVSEGYGKWLLQLQEFAEGIVAKYPEPIPEPIPAELKVARGIWEHTAVLSRELADIREKNHADFDRVVYLAQLSASLAEVALVGWTVEGKSARERALRGSRTGGVARAKDRSISAAQVQEIHRLAAGGMNKTAIAKKVGVSRPTVDKYLKK